MSDTIEKLTDGAIKKRIALIERLRATRKEHVKELLDEIAELNAEHAALVTAQIERLKAQLPAVEATND